MGQGETCSKGQEDQRRRSETVNLKTGTCLPHRQKWKRGPGKGDAMFESKAMAGQELGESELGFSFLY